MTGNKIGEASRIVDEHDGNERFGWDFLGHAHPILELVCHGTGQGFHAD